MKKNHNFLVFVVVFLVLVCLLQSIYPGCAGASEADEEIVAGIQFFKSGKYQQAYDTLLAHVEDVPENQELNFYLGRAAFEIGNYEMAVMAFERILIAKPDENRVKLEIARAFHMMNANEIARRYCKEVLSTNPPEAVKKNIIKFLAFMDKSEQKHFFSGSLCVGVDWNNNVWASPGIGTAKTLIGDIQLTGDSAKKTQDWAYSTMLVMNHTYAFQPGRFMGYPGHCLQRAL